jgi:hypothetical protein
LALTQTLGERISRHGSAAFWAQGLVDRRHCLMTRWIITIMAASLLAGCATAAKLDAAGDVHALLVAVRDNDKAEFDAHIDRDALKDQLQQAITARAEKSKKPSGLESLATLLAQPMAELAADQVLQPKVFQMAARQFGYDSARPLPDRLAITASLKSLDDQTVCAVKSKSGPCVLTFHKADGVWRLSGFGPEAGIGAKVK